MTYLIGGHRVSIEMEKTDLRQLLMRQYRPFETDDDGGKSLIEIVVDESCHAFGEGELRTIREADTGNGIITVSRLMKEGDNAGYQFEIKNTEDVLCALLVCKNGFNSCRCSLHGNESQMLYGFNSAVMICYAFATAPLNTLLVHASMVRKDGRAYAFIAKSGTGKSTHVGNWLKYIPGCDLMNDDNPIFRVTNGEVMAYGSPWSGKTPCYRNVSAPLNGVAKIMRSDSNWLEKLPPVRAFSEVLVSCSLMKWDVELYKATTTTVSRIVENISIYNMHCLPDRESAEVAVDGMT